MNAENKVVDDFYKFCLTTCSERRLKKIQLIIRYAQTKLKTPLNKLKVEDVVEFLKNVNQSEYTAWTKNDYKKIFKRFVKWFYKDLEMIEGAKVKDGFRTVSKKRAFNKEKINKNTLVKPEELEKLLRTAKSLKWKALISFAYESAFRPCEIKGLQWKHIKFDDSLGICRVWTLSPKTKEDREIPVKDCVVHLKRWRDEYQFPDRNDNDFVFPSQHERNKPMGDGVITEMFKRLCKDAKLRNIFPYMFRHSRIYEIQKRLPEKIAAKFAGHSIETSEIYNHLADDDVEESMLKEIYTTKELSEEEKTKLEKEVDELKQLREQDKKENAEIKIMLAQVLERGNKVAKKN